MPYDYLTDLNKATHCRDSTIRIAGKRFEGVIGSAMLMLDKARSRDLIWLTHDVLRPVMSKAARRVKVSNRIR